MGGDENDDDEGFRVDIEKIEDYKFEVTFDKESMDDLVTDEIEDVGGDEEGPNPSRLLAASVLNCLMASLTYCLKKKRIETTSLKGEVKGKSERIDGRLRISELEVNIDPELDDEEDREKLKHCIDIFEDYCVVTQSVRNGIDVDIDVEV